MDHGGGGGGGGRSSSRLRDRLARMFRPSSLLRSTCNNTTAGAGASPSCASSSPAGAFTAKSPPPPPPPVAAAASACSSSRALLAAAAAVARDGDGDSFLASSRRDLVGRTESFSTAVDRLHHHRRLRRRDAPPQPSRFSVDAPPASTLAERSRDKEKTSPLGGGGKGDKAMVRMKLLSNPYGFSSSDEDDADTDVFTSDGEDGLAGGRGVCGGSSKRLAAGESAETFFSSSRSFSSDSSEFYSKKHKKKTTNSTKPPAASSGKPPKPPRPTAAKRGQRSQVHPAAGAGASRHHRRAASSCDTCGVRDGFRPVVSAAAAAEEQVRRGFAVVKRSRDPYADFRSSMVEMIVGRQLFGGADMERLLRSYLALNAPRHHPVILQAFSDIWVVVHGG